MNTCTSNLKNFRLQMPTTIFFGVNEFERVKKAASLTGKKALIVIGKGSVKKHGYLSKLQDLLDQQKISHDTFEGIEPNPKSHTVNAAGRKASQINADMIIALGGGSVMDASKGVAVVAKTGDDVWEYCYTREQKPKKISSALPVICIPTLAATGSEVNGTSVISNPDSLQKSVIRSPILAPKYSIIDPMLTSTVPNNYIVDGAVDIICHCIETYLSCKNDVRVPDYTTLGVTRTVKLAVEEILSSSDAISARADLCWASSVAMIGMFSGRQGGWPIHEIEHALSGIYDISHGLGLAWLMPSMMEFSREQNPDKTKKFVGFFLHENTFHYSDCDSAINDFKLWLNEVGALRPISNQDIDLDRVAQMTLDIYANSDGYIFGPVPMYKKDILKVLELAISS